MTGHRAGRTGELTEVKNKSGRMSGSSSIDHETDASNVQKMEPTASVSALRVLLWLYLSIHF